MQKAAPASHMQSQPRRAPAPAVPSTRTAINAALVPAMHFAMLAYMQLRPIIVDCRGTGHERVCEQRPTVPTVQALKGRGNSCLPLCVLGRFGRLIARQSIFMSSPVGLAA